VCEQRKELVLAPVRVAQRALRDQQLAVEPLGQLARRERVLPSC